MLQNCYLFFYAGQYRQKSNGSIEEIEIHCEPNGIGFYADDFSPYVLTWELKSAGNPGTGESSTAPYIAIILALVSMASITAVFIYKDNFSRSAK